MKHYPRVLTVQDLSCVGQCSLAAALPVLCACGAECCVLPTAILSNHTGREFSGFTFRDLTDDLPGILAQWERDELRFDALSIGYLGSQRQLELMGGLMDRLRETGTLCVLDPVMGDNGRFYSGFSAQYAAGMAQLCRKSDVILPNLTEAAFLLGEEPPATDLGEAECAALARRLCALGPGTVILTGLRCLPGQVSNLIYEKKSDTAALVSQPEQPGQHHGTGDLFASACLGLWLRGLPLQQAAERAGAFVAAAISATEPEHAYGVRFESCLGLLTE